MRTSKARTDLHWPVKGLQILPEPGQVFVDDQQWLAGHLHPLVTIDLSLVNKRWSGAIHLLSPVEPDEVTIGWRTAEVAASADPTGMLRENWLSFRVEGDRMRFLGDERFFALSHDRDTAPMDVAAYDRLRAFGDEQARSYDATRRWFARNESLVRLDRRGLAAYGNTSPVPVLSQLGGLAQAGNWAGDDFPLEYTKRGRAAVPISPAGHRFHFIAEVPGWHYRTAGADGILLFFEPVEQLALLTFDYT